MTGSTFTRRIAFPFIALAVTLLCAAVARPPEARAQAGRQGERPTGTDQFAEQTGSAWMLTFTGHDGPVWPVCFSPDGKNALSGSDDRTLILWDITR